MIRKRLELPRPDFYKTHLKIVNSVLPVEMSNREISILAEFLAIEKDRFSKQGRDKVKSALGISDSNLSNYMKSLTQKGILISYLDEKSRRKYKIHDVVKPHGNGQEKYEFLLCVKT